jgi:hypothetical protein
MYKLIKYFMFFVFLFNFALFADDGDKRVKMSGKMKESTPKFITPRELEKSMKTSSFKIYNPWEKQEDSYEGVFISDFVAFFGDAHVEKLKLIAIDDYEVTFEKKMWDKERILLVTKMNGKYLPIKEKGPMRIVFVDYDKSKKEYELNLPLWMWMINRVEFK